jgi:hypothetical protein
MNSHIGFAITTSNRNSLSPISPPFHKEKPATPSGRFHYSLAEGPSDHREARRVTASRSYKLSFLLESLACVPDTWLQVTELSGEEKK